MVTALVKMLGPVIANEWWSRLVAPVELPEVRLCRKPLPSGHVLQPRQVLGRQSPSGGFLLIETSLGGRGEGKGEEGGGGEKGKQD